MLTFNKNNQLKQMVESAKYKYEQCGYGPNNANANSPYDIYRCYLINNELVDYSQVLNFIYFAINGGEMSYFGLTGRVTFVRSTHINSQYVWDVEKLPFSNMKNYKRGLYSSIDGYVHMIDNDPIDIFMLAENIKKYNDNYQDAPFTHNSLHSLANIIIGLFEAGLIRLFIGDTELSLEQHSNNLLWFKGL